jgi:hypothetical protein
MPRSGLRTISVQIGLSLSSPMLFGGLLKSLGFVSLSPTYESPGIKMGLTVPLLRQSFLLLDNDSRTITMSRQYSGLPWL